MLVAGRVTVAVDDRPITGGEAPVFINVSDGTRIDVSYWRLTKDGIAQFDSFDHRQLYGRPEPVDAVAQLAEAIDGRECLGVEIDRATADLTVRFDGGVSLTAFGFSNYETWLIRDADGTTEVLSNHLTVE
jgi:hypothetical protein